MQNYKMILSYDGSRYLGWQGQGNTDNTIQAKVSAALERLTEEPVHLQASGRTDAGVHARAQVVTFTLNVPRDPRALMDGLNRYLPEDIGLLRLEEAPPRFHARLSATGKTYAYRIWTSPLPDVFGRKYRYHLGRPLDREAMARAARLLEGTHDFRSFCGLTRFKKSTIRTVFAIGISQEGDTLTLTFRGNGFLNRMVRILAGTLVEVGLGLRPADSMPALLSSRDRAQAGETLPAHGLMLEEVYYTETAQGQKRTVDIP